MAYPFEPCARGSSRAKTESKIDWNDRAPRWKRHSRGTGRRRSGPATGASPGDSSVLFEPLEPRLLLSADLIPFSIDMVDPDIGNDLTLHFDSATQVLRLLDNRNDGALLTERAAAETNEIRVTGTESDDRLTLDVSGPLQLDLGFSFEGGIGSDWLTLRFDSFFGSALAFAGGEGRDGVSALKDADFDLDDDALDIGGDLLSLSGVEAAELTGGAGANTLDASGFTGDAQLLGLGGDDTLIGGLGDDLLSGGEGDDLLMASQGADVYEGGAGSDTLAGGDEDNAWEITAADAGRLNGQAFFDVENLIGGAGDDSFAFLSGGSLSGTVEGGGGVNTFDYSARTSDVSVDLSSGAATDIGGLAAIQNVIGGEGNDDLTGDGADNLLVGGGGDDRLAGRGGSDGFQGGAGDDTLIGPDGDAIWQIAALNAGTLDGQAFSGIEALLGGAGDDSFLVLPGGSVTGTVDGGGGTNTLDYRSLATGVAVSFVMGVASATGGVRNLQNVRGGAGDDELEGDAGANLLDGGAGDDRLVVGAGADQVIGGVGADTLAGPAADSVWTLTGAGEGALGATGFSGIENLEGAADNEDTFVVAPGGSLAGLIDGGAGGFDTLVVEEGGYSSVVSTATGPDSGTVALDNITLRYAGLEPVLIDAGTANNQVYNLPADSSDVIEIRQQGAGFILDSINGTFEDTSFTVTAATVSVTVNLGNFDDTVTILNLSGTALEDILTVTGGGGSDTLIVTRDSDLTLSNSAFTSASGESIGLSGFESAQLTGGGSANILDASGFAGSATLRGEGGGDTLIGGSGADTLIGGLGNDSLQGGANDDTYVFEDNWGSDTIVEAAGGGTDTLDFDLYTGTLAFNDATGAIEGGSNSVDGLTNAERIINGNFELGASLRAALLGQVSVIDASSAPSAFVLASDLTFTVTVDGEATEVQLAAANTDGTNTDADSGGGAANASLADLIADLNFALAQAGLEGIVEARAEGALIQLAAVNLVDSLQIDGGLTALGFAAAGASSDDNGQGLVQLVAWGEALAEFGLLGRELPLVNQLRGDDVLPVTVGDALDLSDTLIRLREAFQDFFDGAATPTTDDLISFLNGDVLNGGDRVGAANKLDLGAFGTLTVTTPATPEITLNAGTPEILFNLDLDAQRGTDFDIALGAEADIIGLSFEGTLSLNAVLDAMLGLGLTLGGTPAVFLEDSSTLGLTADIDATNLNSAFNFGFLTATINNGSIDLDASVGVVLDGGADGRLSLAELAAGSVGSVADLTEAQNSLTTDLPIAVDAAGLDAATQALFAGARLALSVGDVFSEEARDIQVLDSVGAELQALLDFSNISPAEVIPMLTQLADTLTALTASDLLALQIPLAEGRTLGDLLNFAQTFKATILDPLFTSGDSSVLDADGDGAPDLTFDSAQELAQKLQELLGGTVEASFDPTTRELTFPISFNKALFADVVVTSTDGGGGSDEVQRLTVTKGAGSVFVLAFGGGVTANIRAGAGADEVDAALEGLAGIGAGDTPGAGDVSVTLVSDSGSETVYDITFQGELADRDVEALVANALPVDFSLDLGDLANVESNSTIGLNAALGLNLIFGIDLAPKQEIIVAPSANQPQVENGILSGLASFDVTLFNVSDTDTDPDIQIGSFTVTVPRDTSNSSLEDLVADVQTAVDEALIAAGLTLGFTSLSLTDAATAASPVVAGGASLLEPGSNIRFNLNLSDSGGDEDTSSGRLQQNQLLGNSDLANVAQELQDSLAAALAAINADRASDAQISITVGTSGDRLTFATEGLAADETLELSLPSLIVAEAGGGRISLVAPPVNAVDPTTADEFTSPEFVMRRVEILITDPGDPALTELGLLSSPTRFDGVLTNDAEFTLVVNGVDVPVLVLAENTDGTVGAANQTLDDLVADLQAAIDLSLAANGFAAGDVEAFRVTDDGNRIGFKGGLGVGGEVVNRLAISVPDVLTAGGDNGAIVDLGLDSGDGAPARAKATQFFFDALDADGDGTDEPTFGADLTIDLSDINASASFGFLGVQAASAAGGDNRITASGSFSLQNPTTGGSRVTVGDITDAIAAGKFTGPDGLIQGSLGGEIDVDLELTPDLGFGTPIDPVTLAIDLAIPNWLDGQPGIDPDANVAISGGGFADFEKFTELSFGNVIEALQLVIDMLRSLDGTSPTGDAVAEALETPLPFVNRSVTDLVSMADEFAEFLQGLEENPSNSVQLLETQLKELLGLDGGSPNILSLVDFDDGGSLLPTLRFDFSFAAGAESSLPLALDFEGLDGFAGVDTDGNLLLDVNAGLDLAVGVDLSGSGTEFFLFTDDGDMDGNADTRLFLNASATGSDLEFSAVFGPVGVFVRDGSASLNGSIDVTLDGGADNRFDLTTLDSFSASNVIVDLAGSAAADLPISIGTEDAPIPLDGSLSVTIDDLQSFIQELIAGNLSVVVDPPDGTTPTETVVITTPDFTFSVPSILDLIRDPSILIGGLDSFLVTLEDALNGQLFGIELPFVGDALGGAADFIGDIREDLLTPLANLIRNVPDPVDLLQGFLFDVFHNDLDLLLDSTGDDAITIDDIRVINADDFLQFDFLIGDEIPIPSADIDFDLGIPGLGLDIDVELITMLDWSIDFGFGISEAEGFYFVTQRTDENGEVIEDPADPDPEVELDLEISLASGGAITGQLGFLALEIVNGLTVNGNDEDTRLFLQFDVDLQDPGEDGRLTFPELLATPIGDIFDPSATGGADVRAQATVDFSSLVSGTVLPAISTEIFVDWDIMAGVDGVMFDSPDVSLRHITLDLGSFISDFAGPILEDLGDIIEPLGFLVDPDDGLLFKRLPLISDLAGSTVTLLDLAETFAPDVSKIRPFIDAISELFFLIDLVSDAAAEADGDSIMIEFGSLVLSGSAVGIPGTIINLGPQVGDLRDRPDLRNINVPDQPKAPTPTDGAAGKFTSSVTRGSGSIDFAIFEPENIFKLLLGQDNVDLVTYDLPEFAFDFSYTQRFPIFGPLFATLTGSFSAGIDLAIGYDTFGLSQFRATGNAASLLDGFFFSDVDLQTQTEVVEAFLKGSIAAGAELNLGVARGGVEGGIEATILFDFNDPNRDGKIRVGELAANLVANSFNPVSVFDVSGMIDFFIKAFVEVNLLFFKFSRSETIVDITLFEFDIPFDRPANLASQAGDVLTINVGPNSEGRFQGDLRDFGEDITVRSDGGVIEVFSNDPRFNVPSSLAQRFTGVNKIEIFGGSGDDRFDLSGVDASVEIEAHGGAGNDIIFGGDGNDMLFGDAGDDILEGRGGTDTIRGGTGRDTLRGGDDEDELFGDAGDDMLFGEDGSDTLDGGAGNDMLDGGAPGTGADTFLFAAGGGRDQITGAGGEWDTLKLPETGEPATFVLKDGQVIAGIGDGADTDDDGVPDSFTTQITGSLSVIDMIVGSNQSDTFHVFDGAAGSATTITLDGASGSDRYILHGEDGAPAASANVTVHDTGNAWELDSIVALGNDGSNGSPDDDITLTNSAISFDFGGTTLTMNYDPPLAEIDPILLIDLRAGSGDDTIRIASTAATVPVRVNSGEGDDIIVVGNSTNGLDDILGTTLAGAGLGPMVLIGDAGHDVVIFDDGADTSDNFGNLTAFLESREGVDDPVEVGVLSGLDTILKVGVDVDMDGLIDRDMAGDPIFSDRDGRIEFEGFEVADVRLGTGNDTFTIGGGFNIGLALDDPARGTAEGRQLVDTALPSTRFADPSDPDSLGIIEIVNSITGLTIVSGGDEVVTPMASDPEGDTFNVIATNDLDSDTFDRDDLNAQLGLLSTSTVTEGDPAGTDEVQRLTIDAAALKASSAFGGSVGYFTLQFEFQETKPIAFDATAAEIQDALSDLPLIGRNILGDSNVQVTGSNGVFDITFVGDKAALNQQQIRARVVPLAILGGAGVDNLNVESIDQTAFFLGGDDDDFVFLNVDVSQVSLAAPQLPSPPEALTSNGVNATVTLDGEGGNDSYNINLIGGITDSQVNVFDTAGDGFNVDTSEDTTADRLTVFGVDDPDNGDLFLLRAGASENALAFIALLNEDGSKPAEDQPVERVNYNTNLEQIVVESLQGDDEFYIDDTRATITIRGGEGDDFFQIGQLYKTPRTPALAGVAPEDVYATIETTRGFLSNGISDPMTIFGDAGEDSFIVFRNQAVLTLNGGDDNDSFLVQAFALVGSVDDERARTDLTGDGGADLIQYAVNAPVQVNGGDGLDTVIVIGTEFNDDFVVTEEGVFGAGLNVNFVNIEFLEIDGAEGDDRFFILGTGENFVTRVVGSLGSDTFNVNGPTPQNGVISNDLRGHSGIIEHIVASDLSDSIFQDLKVEGISANVADNDEPAIVVTQSDGASNAYLGGIDDYTVALTRPPREGSVRITVTPPKGLVLLQEDPNNPGDFIEVRNANGEAIGFKLVFTAANWFVPQTVKFKLDETLLAAEPDFVLPDLADIEHAVESDDIIIGTASALSVNGDFLPEEPGLPPKLEAKLVDKSGLGPFPTAGSEGLPEGLRGAFVTIANSSDPEAVGQTRLILEVVDENTLILDRAWDVIPTDAQYEIQLFGGVQVPNVRVAVASPDIPSIIVEEIDGIGVESAADTTVAEGAGDSGADFIQVRLSQPVAAGETVTVDLKSSLVGSTDVGVDGQLRFFDESGVEITSLTFDDANPFDQFQKIKVVAFDDGVVEGFHNVDLVLTASHSLDPADPTMVGAFDGVERTLVAGVADNDAPGVRIIESGGSTDVIEFDPDLISAAGESQTQTDNVFSGNVLTYEFDLGGVPIIGDAVLAVSAVADLDLFSETLKLEAEGVINETLFQTGGTQYGLSNTTVTISQSDLQTLLNDDGKVTLTVTPSSPVDDFSFFFGPSELTLTLTLPANVADPAGVAAAAGFPAIDSYQVALTKAPQAGETVTVTVDPRDTRTSRTGGIVTFAEQVEVSLDGVNFFSTVDLTFTDANWDSAQTVYVRALDDARVDGGDTKVFASQLDQVNSIQGPLFLVGGEGTDRTGLLEREPIMLPGEFNVKPSLGDAVSATEATPDVAATITIDPTAAGQDLLDALGVGSVAEITAELLIDKTIEITDGPAKNKLRIVTDAEIVDANTIVLSVNRSWASVFTGDLSLPTADSSYTIFETNPNFLVNEAEQVDFLVVDDTDNINSFDDPALPLGTSNPFAEGRMFFDDVNPFGTSGEVLNKFRITGFGMGGDREIGAGTADSALQPGGITYEELEIVEVNLGDGNNRLTVDDSIRRADGFQTWTIVNTGGGDDEVTVNLDADTDGRFALNTQGGDDTVLGAGSTQPLVIFGGDGKDDITGGAGDDIVFGDRGQVDFLDDNGAIVTRLGVTPKQITGSVSELSSGQNLVDSSAGFPVADPEKTADRGLAGLFVAITDGPGVGQQRLITGNSATELFLDEPWDTGVGTGGLPDATSKYLILTTPEFQTDGIAREPDFLRTVDPDVGDADTIRGGAGRDIVFGGAGADMLNALGTGVASDIVLGDHGEAIFDSDGFISEIRTTDPDSGGGDIITGGAGANIIFGGDGDDNITAGGDDSPDIILGDNGFALFANGIRKEVSTSRPDVGGVDTLIAGDGPNVLIGGSKGDNITGGAADEGDIILGDNGTALFSEAGDLIEIFSTVDLDGDGQPFGGDDTILAGNGADVIIGGSGSDRIEADGDDDFADIVLGDSGRATFRGNEDFDPGEESSTLSFNFNASSSSSSNRNVTGAAGAPGANAGNWNNLIGDGPQTFGDESGEIVIFDGGEIAPGITVEWGEDLDTNPDDTSQDSHSQIITGDDQDKRLFEGYLYTATNETLGVNIGGLDKLYESFDLYIYIDADNGRSSSGTSLRQITAGGQTLQLNDPDGNTFDGTYVEATAGDPLGNYVVFRGLTGADLVDGKLQIRIDDVPGSTSNRPALNGLQIVGQSNPIDRIESIEEAIGGDDMIFTGGGADIVIGGQGSDRIESFGQAVRGGTDADIVVGDNARATFMMGELREIRSTAPDVGAGDMIFTGNGEDVVIGGIGDDEIRSGADQPFDNGDVTILSINFQSDVAKGLVTGVAGAAQADNWNNLVGDGPRNFGNDADEILHFDDGSVATGVEVTWGRSLDGFPRGLSEDSHNQIDPDTQNERLFEGYLHTSTSGTIGVDVSGLSDHISGSYDVYVYIDAENNDSRSGESLRQLSIGEMTLLLDDPDGNTFAGEFVASGDGSLGNYVVFRGVTGDDFSLRIDNEGPGSANRPALTALQIVGGPDKDGIVVGGDFDSDAAVGDNGVARFLGGELYEIKSEHTNLGGDDRIWTGEDGDLVIGGSGGDEIDGQAGDDLLLGDNARLILFDGEVVGLDDFDIDDGDDDPFDILGIQLLSGADGEDEITGGKDDDLSYGQGANDTFIFGGLGLGNDGVVEAGNSDPLPNDGQDKLDFSTFGAGIDVELSEDDRQTINGGRFEGDVNLRLTLYSGTAVEGVVGTLFSDDIDGNSRNNILIGGDGNDSLDGESGDDILLGGGGADLIVGRDGSDLVDGGSGDDRIYGGGFGDDDDDDDDDDDRPDARNILLGGDGHDWIRGGSGSDLIDGEAGNDDLRGGRGDDIVVGGTGNDVVLGEGGRDKVEGGEGADFVLGGSGVDQVAEDTLAGPLGYLGAVTDFQSVFGFADFFFVDPTVGDNDRPLREWVDDYLATIPQNDFLLAAAPAERSTAAAMTDETALGAVLAAAKTRLAAAHGFDVSVFDGASLTLGELPGLALGKAEGQSLVLDSNAAGHGWYLDATPGDDDEFAGKGAVLTAQSGSEAEGRMDLLTVVMHELGHMVGLDHAENGPGLMSGSLEAGQRLMPAAAPAPVSSVQLFDDKSDEFLSYQEFLLMKRLDVEPPARGDDVGDSADDWVFLGSGGAEAASGSEAADGEAVEEAADGASAAEGLLSAGALGKGIKPLLVDWNASFGGIAGGK